MRADMPGRGHRETRQGDRVAGSAMESFSIYLTGVGGQGIGLLSEVLLRAGGHAGLKVKGVDTHGLAQRGGIVVSQVRFGDAVFSPLIPRGRADMVVALERHEALRGMNQALRDNGILVYYDAVWQPLDVRLNAAPQVSPAIVGDECRRRGIREIRVFQPDLANPQMQNILLLAAIDRHRLIPGLETRHYLEAMADLMDGDMLARNLQLFEAQRTA